MKPIRAALIRALIRFTCVFGLLRVLLFVTFESTPEFRSGEAAARSDLAKGRLSLHVTLPALVGCPDLDGWLGAYGIEIDYVPCLTTPAYVHGYDRVVWPEIRRKLGADPWLRILEQERRMCHEPPRPHPSA